MLPDLDVTHHEMVKTAYLKTHNLVSGLPKKSGQCPYLIPVTAGSCDNECRSDLNCRGMTKCCSNGCGTQCVEPIMLTGGWHTLLGRKEVVVTYFKVPSTQTERPSRAQTNTNAIN
jgi:hypothetical protein